MEMVKLLAWRAWCKVMLPRGTEWVGVGLSWVCEEKVEYNGKGCDKIEAVLNSIARAAGWLAAGPWPLARWPLTR